MKILITGANGRLGHAISTQLSPKHELVLSSIDGEYGALLDITQFDAVQTFIESTRPDIIIHPAAWTDVDGCARDPEQALLVNGYGTQNVAQAAASIGASLVYISSNEVFNGRSSRPYYEYDRPDPVNAYGYSKWVGEQCVMAASPRHMIVRVAWLFAHGGRNFVQAILNAADQGKALRIVTDEVANPTYNEDAATAIAALIETGRYGIYHLTNEGATSRYHFARRILDQAGYADTPATQISIKEWPRPSQPPTYSALANVAARSIGIQLRSWQDALDAFLLREGHLQSGS